MAGYTLTGKADDDILAIAGDSVEHRGLARAERYVLGLHEAFARLAEFPDMGRNVDNVRPGYLQVQSGSHAIFYRETESGILIVRVLHGRMDVARHL